MTTTARGSANPPHPSTRQAVARGVLLLIGGLVVILVVEPVGPKMLYWMPLIIGLTYLVSSIAGGRSGLWVPGLMVTAWGVATTTVLSGAIRADFTATTILAIGIGAILATQLPRVGFPATHWRSR